MVVETTDGDLGERDVSKPKVAEVVRDPQGQVEKLVVEKGAIFRKEIEVPAERIESVTPEARDKESRGEVTIGAREDEIDALKTTGTEALLPGHAAERPEVDDVFEEMEDAPPTEEGMRRREGQRALAAEAALEGGEAARPPRIGRISALLRTIGPGFLSGMAGNDPSAVTSYAINGAVAGFGLLWLMVLATPMYQAVIYACGKIGRVTQRGLTEILREHYGRKGAALPTLLLVIGNVALIAADLSAVGSGLELVTGISWIWFIVPVAVLLWYTTVYQSFGVFKRIFLVLSLAFVAYLITGFLAHPLWSSVLKATFVPHLSFDFAGISGAVALLGATISPYTMFWQANGEKEESRAGSTRQQMRTTALDIASGTVSGNLVAYAIILSTAATLYTHHRQIVTAADAALGLESLLGPFAKYLFAAGLVGAGIVSIPVLLASTSYAISGTFGWPASLWRKPWQNEGFYLILTAALVASLIVAFLGFSPIQLMFDANILQTILAPALVVFVLVIGNSRKIMRSYTLGWLTNIWLVLTTLILVVASVLLLYGLATGRGG